jgi:hypothetical protein
MEITFPVSDELGALSGLQALQTGNVISIKFELVAL